MSNAGSQLANRSQLVRLGHQLVLALALSYVAKENQNSANFTIFPKGRCVRFGIARNAFGLKHSHLAFSIVAGQRALQILLSYRSRFRRDEVEETFTGNCHWLEAFGTFVHPVDIA